MAVLGVVSMLMMFVVMLQIALLDSPIPQSCNDHVMVSGVLITLLHLSHIDVDYGC